MSIMLEVSRAFVVSGRQGTTVSNQGSPGILVFSRSLQLQYVNRRAIELIRGLCRTMAEVGRIVLPARVLDLRNQLKARLDQRLKADIWEPFEDSRVMSERGQRVLLRGFGRPDRAESHSSRIIIVLEELRTAAGIRPQQARSRMRTPRFAKAAAPRLAISHR